MNATVLSYDLARGWGFTLPDDGLNDVLLHGSNLPLGLKYPNVGDRISYEAGERDGRPLALRIHFVPPTLEVASESQAEANV